MKAEHKGYSIVAGKRMGQVNDSHVQQCLPPISRPMQNNGDGSNAPHRDFTGGCHALDAKSRNTDIDPMEIRKTNARKRIMAYRLKVKNMGLKK